MASLDTGVDCRAESSVAFAADHGQGQAVRQWSLEWRRWAVITDDHLEGRRVDLAIELLDQGKCMPGIAIVGDHHRDERMGDAKVVRDHSRHGWVPLTELGTRLEHASRCECSGLHADAPPMIPYDSRICVIGLGFAQAPVGFTLPPATALRQLPARWSRQTRGG